MSGGLNYCEPCLQGEETNIAVVHCVDCTQSLCKTCKIVHERLKSLSLHKLCNIDDGKPDAEKLDFLKSLTKCQEHQSEEVRYICKDHDHLCCNECAIVKHRKCDHLVSLSDEMSTQGTICKEAKKRLDEIEHEAEKLIKIEKDHDSTIQASIVQVEEKLVNMKNAIDEAFLKKKQAIEYEVKEKTGSIQMQTKVQIERIETLTIEIDSLRRKLEFVYDNRGNIHLFLVGKKLTTELTRHQEMFQKLLINSKDRRNIKLVEKMNEQDLMEIITSCFHIEETASPGRKDLEPTLVYEVKTSLLTGNAHSCVWIENYLVVAKQQSNEIQLFDVVDKTLKYNTTKTSSSAHRSVAKIDNSRFVICFPQTKTLEITKIINGAFVTDKSIETCNDITDVTFNKLSSEIICLSRSGAIDCYKLDGTKSRSLSLTPLILDAVKNAYSICFDSGRQVLYISCHTLHKLLAVRLDGGTVFEYRSPKLKYPWYLDIDRDGNIYLPFYDIEGGKGAVQQIDTTGKLLREIKLPGNGTSVCFDGTGTKFVISCSARKYLLQMYHFK